MRISRNPRRAFSLVELLIVISIMGVLLGVATTYLSTDVPAQLEMAAHSVAGDCEYVRGLAVANNSTYRLKFNVSKNNYYYEHTGAVAALDNLPPSPFHKFDTGKKGITDTTQANAELGDLPMVAGGVKLAAVQKNPASPSHANDLEFNPYGATTRPEATIIWLVSSAAGTEMYIPITVNSTTGIVSVGDVQQATPDGL